MGFSQKYSRIKKLLLLLFFKCKSSARLHSFIGSMSDVYYARPVTVTDERLRDAMEKQAKQKALREALDSQINGRGDGTKSVAGLSKAQQKRLEIMQLQAERDQQVGQQQMSPLYAQPQVPGAYQSHSLPPNFAMSSSIAFNNDGGGGMRRSVAGLPQQPPSAAYDSHSLPAGFGYAPTSGPSGGGAFQAPNFNIAEMYAQQQQLHAPCKELPVPLSPRLIASQSQQQQQLVSSNSDIAGGGRAMLGGGNIYGHAASNNVNSGYSGGASDVESVSNILRLAKRVTDNPTSPSRAHGHSRDIPHAPPEHQQPGSNPSGRRGQEAPPSYVPQRANSKEAKSRAAATPTDKTKQDRTQKETRVAESRVEKLQKELQDRQHEMQRMRDKERDWEDQVKQLKVELKNARQKERDLSKMVGDKPQRAETAPNTGSISKLAPLQQVDAKHGGAAPRLSEAGRASHVSGPAGAPGRKDFNNARVFSNETFRPITAPLEPIEDVLRTSQQQLPPLPDSLKMASFNTRKVAFGLQHTEAPIPMSYETLCDFVKSQVVTQQQADALWVLFSGEDPPKKRPSPPPGARPNDPSRRATVPTSPTYETYAELDDDEDGYDEQE